MKEIANGTRWTTRGCRTTGGYNRRTVAKLLEVSQGVAEAKKQDVPRAIKTLSKLMVTAMGFTAHYQQKMIAWEAIPENKDKLPPAEMVDRFMAGLNTAIKAAKALAPFQDPQFTAIAVTKSPLDVQVRGPQEPRRDLVLEDEEEAMRIAQAVADLTGKRVTLIDANGQELGTVEEHGKPSRTDQARQVVEEYAIGQREIIKKLRKRLN